MKKLLCFSVIICLLCVSSYAQNDDIITDVTIPTQFMGIKIGEIPTRSQMEKIGLIYDERSTSTRSVASIPSDINWLGGWWSSIVFQDNCIKFGFSTSTGLGVIAAAGAVLDLKDIFGPYNKVTEEHYLWKNQTAGYAWIDQKGTVLECHIIKESEADFSVICYIIPQVLETFNHEYVDLGLSVLWATCNVGANKPEDYGDYFAWGETKPKSEYSLSTYKYLVSGDKLDNVKFSKYVTNSLYGSVDNKAMLDLSDDAARANWGGEWRMPTITELQELRDNCTWTWTTMDGKIGYIVTSKINGNNIFLPAAGFSSDRSVRNAGAMGNYWSCSLRADDSRWSMFLGLHSNGVSSPFYPRYYGQSIRPVMEKKTAQSTPSSSNTLNPSEKVYSSTEVDVAPKFNGGDMGEFTKWVNQNVVYPDIAKQYDIKGRVITKFTIHSNGQISDIQILKGVDPSLDKEAINVLKKAQTLTPAKKGGENVAMSYMLPIDFGR